MDKLSYHRHRFPAEVIQYAVWLYFRFPLSYRYVEDIGIIAIHDVPYEIAKHRNHPHQDAIHAAGWVSLFTLHAIWPFLWIWAMLYRPDRGWGMQQGGSPAAEGNAAVPTAALEQLLKRVTELERRLDQGAR